MSANDNSPPAWRIIKMALIALVTRRPIAQHRKRGTWVRILGKARVQSDVPLTDMDHVIVYQEEDGEMWVRPPSEMFDGRFDMGVQRND